MQRSLPNKKILSQPHFKDATTILKKAVEEHGVEADYPTDYPGLEQVYKLGWLQAEALDDDLIIYSFPSLLHHRYETPPLLIFQIPDITYLAMSSDCFIPTAMMVSNLRRSKICALRPSPSSPPLFYSITAARAMWRPYCQMPQKLSLPASFTAVCTRSQTENAPFIRNIRIHRKGELIFSSRGRDGPLKH